MQPIRSLLLPVLLLMCGALFAQNAPGPEDPANAADIAQNPVSAAPDALIDPAQESLGEQIRIHVLESVTEAINNNPDISPADKQKILARLDQSIEFPFDDDDELGVRQMWIAILAILLIFGSPIFFVIAVLYAGHRKRKIASETASQFLASGQPVPPEVWRGLTVDTSPGANLRKGMMLIGAGLGVILCFWLIGNQTLTYLGLIPLFIGAALLLIWKLEQD